MIAALLALAPVTATGQEAEESSTPEATGEAGKTGSYQIQLKQLEERVADLKEKIF